MKNVDILATILLVVGGLNWGLVGAMNFDLVEAIFGSSFFGSIVYILVGLSAVYQIAQWKSMQTRQQAS